MHRIGLDWAEWDRQNEEWQRLRKKELERLADDYQHSISTFLRVGKSFKLARTLGSIG